jgi:hypothetical protein
MALAESMKTLVNDLKRQRKARHAFVAGNREIVHQMSIENRAYLAKLHQHNKELADQTRQMLQATRDARKADYNATMKSIREDIVRLRQSKDAIIAGARGMINEFREDHKAAQSYWAQVDTDDLIEGDMLSGGDRDLNKVSAKKESDVKSPVPAQPANTSDSAKVGTVASKQVSSVADKLTDSKGDEIDSASSASTGKMANKEKQVDNDKNAN